MEYVPYSTRPYHSARRAVYAPNGVVATSQPLAAQVGVNILQGGGNAVDAAVATAITLTVVEPGSCGIGGDAFAIVWDGKKLHGLNGSGRAPQSLSAETLRQQNHIEVPERGWLSVTTPGAPAAWRDLHARFGVLPFAELFEAAIAYAEKGFPLSPVARNGWHNSGVKLKEALSAEQFANWQATFAPDGAVPQVGSRWQSLAMARGLRLLADSNCDAMYSGTLAADIVRHAEQTGGFLSADDLERHTSTWVDLISTNYRGYDVWEIPPNGQGLAALIALNILEGFDLAALDRDSAESYHLQLEAMKLAFADAQRYIADPEHAAVPTDELLSKVYSAERRKLISDRAALPEAGDPVKGGTAFLCTADKDGIMVSLIESTYMGFGSGIVVPNTGIALQNRGNGFSLEAGHRNELQPGKRPFHTIIPGFLTKDGAPIGPFGVMGGHMQPQGHVQMIVNTVDYGMGPQTSLDASRWHWSKEKQVKLEPQVGDDIARQLVERGHDIEVEPNPGTFGRGQIIWKLPEGGYVAGSEGRADGQAIGY
jgi:gamma-glutamyltranspeptidase/glutathione hydrolase